MILQFGKYRGRDIRDVPTEYLEWWAGVSERDLEETKAEIRRREAEAEGNSSWEERLIQAGFRDLSKRHHPDVGGTNDDMRSVLAAKSQLLEILTGYIDWVKKQKQATGNGK